MVDCPCGYGKNIPETQKTCHICGADLMPLHRVKALPQLYYFELCNIYLQKGLYDEAAACMEKALEISPENEEAKAQRQKALSLKDAQIKKGRLRKQFAIAGFSAVFIAGVLTAHFSNSVFSARQTTALKQEKTKITYKVRKGESFSKIAQERYGNILLWQRIYEANKGKIKDPDKLPVGIEIVLEDILIQPK